VAAQRRGELLLFPTAQSLTYLHGTLPGDQCFDPLGLFDPANDAGLLNQRWLRYAEVIHGRWAMLGALGCIAPEYLAMRGVIPEATGVDWFATGFLPLAGSYDFGTPAPTLFAVQMVLMAWAELWRLHDFQQPPQQQGWGAGDGRLPQQGSTLYDAA
jgi:light-harvesting complex I chlorophyll a/b binding protein 3